MEGSLLKIHGRAPADIELIAGRDLVLEPWPSSPLPDGVLLDDWLSAAVRGQIDSEARTRFEAFDRRVGSALTCDGLGLAHAWEVELIAEVFVWETRIMRGLAEALRRLKPSRIEWRDVDGDLVRCMEQILETEGANAGTRTPPRRYPSAFGRGRPRGLRSRAAGALLGGAGVPRRVRGDVLVWPYWNLAPVFTAARAERRFVPVIDPRHPPPLDRNLLTLAREGGWIGRPGAAARRRSRVAVRRCLRGAQDAIVSGANDPLDELLARRSVAMLAQVAGDTLADLGSARAAFGVRSLRASVVPFDQPPAARVLLHAAREAGVPSLMMQHGFASEPELLQEGLLADVVAVWSETEARNLNGRARGLVEVTGNPGVESRLGHGRQGRPAGRGRTLVMLEYPSRVSARIDARAKIRHLDTALAALAAVRPGADVVVRPHPSDHEPDVAAHVVARHAGLRTSIDRTTPFSEVIGDVDLVIGATSTATLEAAAGGLPVIYLDVSQAGFAAPFDESGVFPTASGEAELAHAVPEALSGRRLPDIQQARDILGMRAGATERVLGLIDDLARSQAARSGPRPADERGTDSRAAGRGERRDRPVAPGVAKGGEASKPPHVVSAAVRRDGNR